jgi:hypothetical protein
MAYRFFLRFGEAEAEYQSNMPVVFHPLGDSALYIPWRSPKMGGGRQNQSFADRDVGCQCEANNSVHGMIPASTNPAFPVRRSRYEKT